MKSKTGSLNALCTIICSAIVIALSFVPRFAYIRFTAYRYDAYSSYILGEPKFYTGSDYDYTSLLNHLELATSFFYTLPGIMLTCLIGLIVFSLISIKKDIDFSIFNIVYSGIGLLSFLLIAFAPRNNGYVDNYEIAFYVMLVLLLVLLVISIVNAVSVFHQKQLN